VKRAVPLLAPHNPVSRLDEVGNDFGRGFAHDVWPDMRLRALDGSS